MPEDYYRIHADDGELAWLEAGRCGGELEKWEVRWGCPRFFSA
jgi:hypothetical protein